LRWGNVRSDCSTQNTEQAIEAHQDWSHALAEDIRSQWPPFTVRISFIERTRKGGEKSS